MYWAEDTIDEFSLAQHVTGDSFSLLTHGNICIVGFFSDYKMYTSSNNHILQYFFFKKRLFQASVRMKQLELSYITSKDINWFKHFGKVFSCIRVESVSGSVVSILCHPMDCSLPDSSVHGISQSKHTGVDSHFFLQGIFPAQGSNPGLLHCRQTL